MCEAKLHWLSGLEGRTTAQIRCLTVCKIVMAMESEYGMDHGPWAVGLVIYIYGFGLLVIKSRIMRWASHVARMGERRGVYRVLMRKSEGKRPLGRPRRRWEDDIKMALHEVGCWGMDWIELAHDMDRWRALVSTVMNLRVP